MAVEREIKTVLTLEDASFKKGLKAAASSVSAARAEMNAAVASASGLGKGFKKYSAQVTGLNKALKAEKQQMAVLNKEYKNQQARLKEATKALKEATKENGAGSEEAKKAANAYAAQSAQVDDLRVKMANLSAQMAKDRNKLKETVTEPIKAAGQAAKTAAATMAVAMASAAAALVTLGVKSIEARQQLEADLSASQSTFGVWSNFIEQDAAEAWKNLGLSKDAYLQEAVTIGEYLQAAGVPVQESAELTSEALQRAADLAGEHGTTTAQALEAIENATKGSYKQMTRYGLKITSTTIKEWALNRGLIKTNTELSKEQEGAYALMMILDKTEDAQNGFQERTDGLNKSLENFNAAWANFLDGSGSATDVVTAFSGLAESVSAEIIKLAPALTEGITGLIQEFALHLPENITTLTPALETLLDGILSVLTDNPEAIGESVGTLVGTLAAKLIARVPDIVMAGWNMGKSLVNGLFKGFSAIWRTDIWPAIQDTMKVTFGVDMPDWEQMWNTLNQGWQDFLTNTGNVFKALVELVFPEDSSLRKSLTEFWNNLLDTMPDWALDAMKFVGLLDKDFKRPSEAAAEQEALRQIVDAITSAAPTAPAVAQIAESLNRSAEKLSHAVAAQPTVEQALAWHAKPGSPLQKAQDEYNKAQENLRNQRKELVRIDNTWLAQVPILGDILKSMAGSNYDRAYNDAREAGNNLITTLGETREQVKESQEKMEAFMAGIATFAEAVDEAAEALADAGKYVKNVVTYAGGGSPVYSLRDISGGSGNFHHLKGFASGLWNVPLDNYLAQLHRGEMVLTADQARRYRAAAASGGATYNESANIYIDKYNQYSGADADALLLQTQAMQRRQRMGYGLA